MRRWSFGDEYLDLRDVEDELRALEVAAADAAEDGEPMDDDELQQLEYLREFKAKFESDSGYDLAESAQNEPTAIRDSYWGTYAEEYANDCGFVDPEGPGRYYFDYDKFADDLKTDYTEFEFDGYTYLIRAW